MRAPGGTTFCDRHKPPWPPFWNYATARWRPNYKWRECFFKSPLFLRQKQCLLWVNWFQFSVLIAVNVRKFRYEISQKWAHQHFINFNFSFLTLSEGYVWLTVITRIDYLKVAYVTHCFLTFFRPLNLSAVDILSLNQEEMPSSIWCCYDVKYPILVTGRPPVVEIFLGRASCITLEDRISSQTLRLLFIFRIFC